MDNQPENNVPNESPATPEPAPAAPEQPAAPEPMASEPAPAHEEQRMDTMGGGEEKKGMSKGMMWGIVALAVLIIAVLIL